MPREQKVGFTILILIVGFAGAFCFRRDSQQSAALPALQNESELNQLISEYQLRPYLPGIDTNEKLKSQQRPGSYLAINSVINNEKTSRKKNVPRPIRSFIPAKTHSPNSSDDIAQQKKTNSQKGNHFSGKQHENSKVLSATFPVKTSASKQIEKTVTHVVQPGETLSGIAQRYFGSASRFGEIYDANQDILSGPNRLKPKMKLIIPFNQKQKTQEVIKEARRAKGLDGSAIEKERSSTAKKTVLTNLAKGTPDKKPSKKKLFLPMRRSPFSRAVIGDSTPSASAIPQTAHRQRKLNQTK